MNNLKLLIHIILCIAALLTVNSSNAQNLDSLKHQIEIQTGKDKHKSLGMYYMLTKDKPEGISYLRSQLVTSEKKNDLETQGKILQLIMAGHYQSMNGDSVLYYVDKIKQVNAKQPLSFYFEVMKASVNMLIADGRYEMALQELDDMLAEATKRDDTLAKAQAYQLMAMVYNSLYQPNQADKYVIEGLQLIRPVKSTELKLHMLHFDLYNNGAVAAAENEDYTKGLVYTDSMYNEVKKIEEYLKQDNIYTESAVIHFYYNTYTQYLTFLTSLKRFDEAKLALDKLTTIAGSPGIPQAYRIATYNHGKAHYLMATGDYDKALVLLDDAMETVREQFIGQYPASLLLKAEILEKQKKFQPALNVYKEVYQIQDSLKKSDLQKNIADLKSVYQVKELEQRVEERELRMRIAYTYIAGISLACLLLIILVFVIRRNAKQQKEKNRALYLQLKEQDKYKAALRKLSTESNPDSEDSNNLYNHINDYVLQTKYYLEPDVSRESLALKIGTNYKYLTDAIKEATGKTFYDYITDLKLEYARGLLTSKPNETIQAIYLESGINSKPTFNRLFAKKFGMAPTDYRIMVKEMQDEPVET